MSRIDSFFLPPERWSAPFVLDADEARHMVKVLRLAPGDTVRLFDGQGREGLFSIASTKGGVTLDILSETLHDTPPARTWLALGWNKAARRGWLLEKAVELGAAGILFWESERSQGMMPASPKESWSAQMVAGAKQCGNPWLPGIETVPGGVAGLLSRVSGFSSRYLLWESRDVRRELTPEDLTAPGDRVFVLGPEGGLTQAEASAFMDAGFIAATLGPRPLRWETAALVCLGLCWWASS